MADASHSDVAAAAAALGNDLDTDNLREYFHRTFEQKLLECVGGDARTGRWVAFGPAHRSRRMGGGMRGSQHADVDPGAVTQATRMLEKKHELAELDEALLLHKEDFRVKMEALQHRKVGRARRAYFGAGGGVSSHRARCCAPRQDELKRKEAQLAESLQKFDKFVKENDARYVVCVVDAAAACRYRGVTGAVAGASGPCSRPTRRPKPSTRLTSRSRRSAAACLSWHSRRMPLASHRPAAPWHHQLEDHVATLTAQSARQRTRIASMQHYERFLSQCVLHPAARRRGTMNGGHGLLVGRAGCSRRRPSTPKSRT